MTILGRLPSNTLIQFPSGRWGFVGTVDARLSIVQKDGSPATPEQIRNVRDFGQGLVPAVKCRTWATRQEALDAAGKLSLPTT